MSNATIARRYAQAFFLEAEKAGGVAEADQDMDAIHKSFSDSAELRRFFSSPVINREQKEQVVTKLFSGKVSDLSLKLLLLLVSKRRGDVAESVATAYKEIRDEVEGRVAAHAVSAIELSDDEEKALVSRLEGITGKKVRLSTEIDSTLIGGLVVKMGDTVYDGSVKHQLAILRERMEKRVYLSN